jgi:hypothetical protein
VHYFISRKWAKLFVIQMQAPTFAVRKIKGNECLQFNN